MLLDNTPQSKGDEQTADGYTAVHLYLAAQKEFGTVQMMDSQTADKNRVSLYLHARANNAKIIVHKPGAQHYICLSPLPNNDLSEASESAYWGVQDNLYLNGCMYRDSQPEGDIIILIKEAVGLCILYQTETRSRHSNTHRATSQSI